MAAKRKTLKKKKPEKMGRFGVVNYSVSDFLIRIKNACMARKHVVEIPNTKYVKNLAQVLKKEGFFDDVKEEGDLLSIRIAYLKKEPLIFDIKPISKPGLRVYMSADKLAGIKGPSSHIVSTNQGIMTAKDAIKKRVGGEVIAEIL